MIHYMLLLNHWICYYTQPVTVPTCKYWYILMPNLFAQSEFFTQLAKTNFYFTKDKQINSLVCKPFHPSVKQLKVHIAM